MDDERVLEYLERQIEDKKKDDFDKHIGKFLVVAFLIVDFVGLIMMPDRYDCLVSIFLLIFGSLGMGYIFGFERGKKEGRI